MRPLSLEKPKSLVPTLGVAQLSWALARAAAAGVERVAVNTRGDQPEVEACARAAGGRLGIEVHIAREPPEALGTAGALLNVADRLEGPVLVVNSDVATDADLGMLVRTHESAGAPATLMAVPAAEGADLTVENSWVCELHDRSEAGRGGHRFAGIGVYEPACLRHIPEGPQSLYETVLTGLMRDGAGIAVHEWDGYWLDVGSPEAHLRANLDALAGALGDPPPSGAAPERWDHLAFVGAGAETAGARLRHAVVGAGSRIAPEATLERCVVWDFTEVPAGAYRDAVVTPAGVVRV